MIEKILLYPILSLFLFSILSTIIFQIFKGDKKNEFIISSRL